MILQISKGSFQYEEVQVGLWCSILVDPKSAVRVSPRKVTLRNKSSKENFNIQ